MNATGPKERATFSLSAATKARLEEVIPKNERSRFVENAIRTALKAEAVAEFGKVLDEMPRTTGGESSTDYLRRARMQWDGRPIDVLEGRAD